MASALRKADQVANDLLKRIVSGEIDVGSLLPREADLAVQYGVNRSVVREAIKLLEVHRLVRPIRRRGTEVLDPVASLSPEVLRAMLMPAPGHVDQRMLSNLLEIRAQIDEMMTVAAAERRSEADLLALRECAALLAESMDEPRRYSELVTELSLIVARASKNVVYEMLVHWHRLVHGELEEHFNTVRPARPEHLAGLHLLIDVIERRDVETARRMVRAFHDWATPRILAAAALATGQPLPAPSGESNR